MFTNIWIFFLIALVKGQFAADVFSTTEPLLPSETDSFPGATQCPSGNPKLRPVIGILTHPGDGASGRIQNSTNASYIATSYVKLVIPLIYNEPSEILSDACQKVHEQATCSEKCSTTSYTITVLLIAARLGKCQMPSLFLSMLSHLQSGKSKE